MTRVVFAVVALVFVGLSMWESHRRGYERGYYDGIIDMRCTPLGGNRE